MKKPAGHSNDHLENSLGYLLHRAAHIIAATFGDELKADDIPLSVWRVLATLNDRDHQSLSELASHTGAELSYLSRTVAQAEERGFVIRSAQPGDKRATSVSITPAGRAIVRKFSPLTQTLQKQWLADIPDADVEATFRTLRAVYRNAVAGASPSSPVNRKITVARRVNKRATLKADSH
ncbi:MAG: MarR family winged helix-turn-helix transcriptional regulator [Pigmentiphaga sp.]|uniref:MarR family winged helix-turn-helix transcriptional regulator n=1 Tax=Pigmentiphaga sp. TaxID=1977564 RepID=UPI003B57B462